MPRPATVDLTGDQALYQGDEVDFTLRLRESDALPAVYRDLTGKVGKAQLRPSAGSSTLLASFTITVLDQTASATRGAVRVFCSSATMESVPAFTEANPARWDLQLTNADGTGRQTVAVGAVEIQAQVTTA